MSQQDLFWKGRTGAELRDHALKKFEEREPRWLDRVRTVLVGQLEQGCVDEVSSDDVWYLCPPPADVHPSVVGAVFKDRRFKMIGWTASARPSAHARVIRLYQLREKHDGR